MRKSLFTVVALVLSVVVSSVSAGTLGIASTPRGDLATVPDLSRLSIGGSYQNMKREVHNDDGISPIEVEQGLAHIGLDVLDWLTLHGSVGEARLDPKLQEWSPDDWDLVWGVGMNARLLTHPIESPDMLVGKCSLEMGAQYSQYEAGRAKIADWEEWLLSAVLRYEMTASGDAVESLGIPHSTVIAVGPLWSELGGDFDSHQKWGLTAGVTGYITSHIGLGWNVQVFEKVTHTFHVGYHF